MAAAAGWWAACQPTTSGRPRSPVRAATSTLWLSVSGDLVVDARRDLDDIGAGQITCYNLKDFKPSMSLDAQGVTEGVLFSTYSLLTSERAGAAIYRCADAAQKHGVEGERCRR